VSAGRGAAGWVVFFVALAPRLGFVLLRWMQHGPALEYPDEALHWQLASNLVHDGALVSDDGRFAVRMPLYPLFLAPFAALGPIGILATRLVQALLGAATALVAWQWLRRAGGARMAIVAGLLVALDPFGVFFANLLLTEVLFTFVAVALCSSAWRLASESASGWRSAILLGVLGAAAIMIRPSAALWIPAIWVLVALLAADRRRMLLRLWICPVALALTLLPWGIRNQIVLGDFAWLSANGGLTLYDAQGPQADGSSDQSFLANMPELATMGEVERDHTLQRRALEQMSADPARVIRLAGIKVLRMWNPLPNVPEYRTSRAAVAGAAYTVIVLVGALVALAVRGALTPAARHRRRAVLALAWLPVVYFTLLHSVYIGSVRYRVPLMPMLAIATATIFARRQPGQPAAVVDSATSRDPAPGT
jgi:4-amino-4-deoxy-L-arabinose transferase-like glycosyltransferase